MGIIGKAVKIRHVPSAVKGIGQAKYPLGATLGRGLDRLILSQKTGLEDHRDSIMDTCCLYFHQGD
jgi:hypothetical protein